MSIKEILEELRKIIDGEDGNVQKMDDFLIGKQARTQSASEEFIQRIMKEVDVVLRNEIVRLPTGNAYIPNGFIVLLNTSDYKKFPAGKRKFAETEMSKLLLERAKELVSNLKISTKLIKLIIKLDATLDPDELNVLPISSEVSETIQFAFTTNKDFDISANHDFNNLHTIDDYSTIIDDDFRPQYWLEVWQSGKKINEFPILLSEITIGRDYPDSKAHIRLKSENQKISGIHTSVQINDNKEIKVIALHKNYTQIGNNRLALRPGFLSEQILEQNELFQIYDFSFKLKF